MAKRYQVFVSSTYRDLREFRAQVIKRIHDMGHFPVGMEIFPASDQTQWDYIKSVIDQSDYYVLILGGCYGSTDESGVGYTEKEYRYAVEKGLHVLVLFREDIEHLPVDEKDTDLSKVNKFRADATRSRLARPWKTESDLISGAIIALQLAIEQQPAIGWVRGDEILSNKDQRAVNQALAENTSLRQELDALKSSLEISDFQGIAGLEDSFDLVLTGSAENYVLSMTWSEIWKIVGGVLEELSADFSYGYVPSRNVEATALGRLSKLHLPHVDRAELNFLNETWTTIEAQLRAYEFIEYHGQSKTWTLCEKGEKALIKSRIAKRKRPH